MSLLLVPQTSYCLIPVTRPEIANKAITSAEADGWKVIIIEDKNKEGVSLIREKLFNLAVKEKAKIIRYLDDDDTILPHLDNLNFDNNDILYTNHYLNKRPIRLTGNSISDTLDIAAWSWIGKVESLQKIQNIQGYLWNPNKVQGREGGWCWQSFIKNNLKIKYLPIFAYVWNLENQSNEPPCKYKTYKTETELLIKALYERNNSSKTSSRNC